MVTLEDIESLGYKKVGKTQKSRVGQGTPPELVPKEVKTKLKALVGGRQSRATMATSPIYTIGIPPSPLIKRA